jgi:hypothetical protein
MSVVQATAVEVLLSTTSTGPVCIQSYCPLKDLGKITINQRARKVLVLDSESGYLVSSVEGISNLPYVIENLPIRPLDLIFIGTSKRRDEIKTRVMPTR